MDIVKSGKRGRPATGRAKDGRLFIRLPREEEGRIRVLVKEALEGSFQSAGVNPEVDRLRKENAMLQARIKELEGF